jgi:crossover junction endodeoxyribonuclease RuvC
VIRIRHVGLDISTKCGLVVLDQDGNIVRAKEIYGVGDEEPKRMVTLACDIIDHIQPDDNIVIEDFALSFGKSNQSQGLDKVHGLGWLVRCLLYMKGHKYRLVKPNQRQAFVGVTGFIPDPSNPEKKKRVSGKPLKQLVMNRVKELYGFDHPSDNVNDGFILAKIAEALYEIETDTHFMPLPSYQYKVLEAILKPSNKKQSNKKSKSKRS